MPQAGSRAHSLNFARFNLAFVAHAVGVLERAVNHVGDDFHFLVRMRRKSRGRLNHVIIKYAQWPERDVLRVVIIVEREMPVRGKPACVQMVAIRAANYLNHGILLSNFLSAALYSL